MKIAALQNIELRRSGKMNKPPLLYYRTMEQIAEYRKKPALQKIKWLEAQMSFFITQCLKRLRK